MHARRLLALAAILILGLGLMPQPARALGRDILLISRTEGGWVRGDRAVAVLADGSRLAFDLKDLPWEHGSEPEDLLFILRTHGLSCNSLLYGLPMPRELPPVGAEEAGRLRRLIGALEARPFEPRFHATDQGSTLIYAVRPAAGEARLVLIAERGTMIGQSPDDTTARILEMAEGWLRAAPDPGP